MPEASVDQNCKTLAGEGDVGGATYGRHRPAVDEEPPAPAMQLAPDGQLRPSVSTAVGPHAPPHAGGGGPGNVMWHQSTVAIAAGGVDKSQAKFRDYQTAQRSGAGDLHPAY